MSRTEETNSFIGFFFKSASLSAFFIGFFLSVFDIFATFFTLCPSKKGLCHLVDDRIPPHTLVILDAKTGLLTGFLSGKQGWKYPVALLTTCCGSKSLKVILIDSDFRTYPVLNPLVTLSLTPSFRTDFFEGKNFSRPVEELEYTCLLKSTFTEASHVRDFKTCQTPATYPECVFCEKMYRWGVAYVECHMDPNISKSTTDNERVFATCAESQSTSRDPKRTRFLSVQAAIRAKMQCD